MGRRGISRALVTSATVAALGLAFGTGSAAARPGDVIVAQSSLAKVLRVDARTAAQQTLASGGGLAYPTGITFLPNRSMLVTDLDAFPPGMNGGLLRLPLVGGVPTLVATSAQFDSPFHTARGADGSLYMTDHRAGVGGEGAVFKFSPRGALVGILSQGQFFGEGPIDILAPPNGPLIVAIDDTPPPTNGAVVRINRNTGAQSVIAVGNHIDGPQGLARTPNGTLYVSTGGGADEKIVRINPRTGAQTVVATGFDSIGDLAINPRGIIYAAEYGAERVTRVDPRTGAKSTLAVVGTPGNGGEGLEVEPPRCKGKLATIVGSVRRDKLNGSRFRDIIAGLQGRDVIRGLKGNDVVCGGPGGDKLIGGSGKDRLLGGAGVDLLKGGPGKDREKQ